MFSDTGRKGERQSKGGNAASFLTAIDAIYAAADNARLWPIALQSLADFFGARGASMSWSSKGAFVSRVSSQALQQAMDNYLAEGWRLKDLRRIRIAQKGLGSTHRAFTDHDLCSADEIRTAPIYTQWCARFGLGWFAAKFVNPDAKLIVGVSVHRSSATRPPFNDDELANLESFAAHIQRALRFNLHKIDAEVFQSALSELFSRLDICVIAINSTAQVVLAVDEGMSLLGDGIGHVAFAGVAAGLLTGTWPVWTALVAAVLAALGIEWLRARGGTSGDLALAVFFYGGIAAGAVLASRAAAVGRPANVLPYLFGSILTVTVGDVVTVLVMGALTVAVILLIGRALLAIAVDEETARVAGLPVDALNALLAVLTAVTVVAAMRVVGLLLVAAMLVLPIATARPLVRSFRATLALAAAVEIGRAHV